MPEKNVRACPKGNFKRANVPSLSGHRKDATVLKADIFLCY